MARAMELERVRPRPRDEIVSYTKDEQRAGDYSEYGASEVDSLNSSDEDDVSEGELSSNNSLDSDDDANTDGSSASSVEETADLKEISFGALAQAQNSLGSNPRKRKRDSRDQKPASDHQRSHLDHQHSDSKVPLSSSNPKASTKVSRSSKHAPPTQSTKHAVGRQRTIFELSTSLKVRDPRFDATVTSASGGLTSRLTASTDAANKNYSFLNDYRATEIVQLKSDLKRLTSSDQSTTTGSTEDDVAALKRRLMSLESRHRKSEALNRQRDVQRQHRKKEREAIRSGQKSKPFYLKRSAVREAVDKDRKSKMGKRAVEKAEVRRERREKGKEGREMPRVRRSKAAV